MADQARAALTQLLAAHRSTWVPGQAGMMTCSACPDWTVPASGTAAHAFAAHLAAVIAAHYLVIPHAVVTGQEFGYTAGPHATLFLAEDYQHAVSSARDIRRVMPEHPVQVMRRPVLRFQPVHTPELDTAEGVTP